MKGSKKGKRVAIVGGCRTPFARAGTTLSRLTAADLGRLAVSELLYRLELPEVEIDEVVLGSVVPAAGSLNPAREVALRAGIPASKPAHTVNHACASACQALISAAGSIVASHASAVIAGGMDSLSMEESSIGRDLAEASEKMALENRISRDDQDAVALRSFQRAQEATEDGRLTAPMVTTWIPPDFSEAIRRDEGLLPEAGPEMLAAMPPLLDPRYGTITESNCAPLADGAAALLVASEEKASALGYAPLGFLRSYALAALPPTEQPLMASVYAIPAALQRAGLAFKELSLLELHEASAAQLLSNLGALASREFAQQILNKKSAIGEIDLERLNVCGGSIAIGHPPGATGARLVMTLLEELKRRGQQFGLVAISGVGGLGVAMIFETA